MKVTLSLFACFVNLTLVAQTLMGDFILGAETGTFLGHSVSMPDAETVAVSAPGIGGNQGFVKVFEWNGSSWTQKGNDFMSDPVDVRLGTGISMPNANTIAMAAIGNDDLLGFIQVYEWTGDEWEQRGDNIICGGNLKTWSNAISMPDLNTVAIGGQTVGLSAAWSGITQVFEWDGDAWVQKGENIESSDPTHLYGNSVHMPSNSTIAISANWGGSDEIDIAKVYEWDGTNWVQKGNPIFDSPNGAAYFPVVNMPSDHTLAVGVPKIGFPQGYAAVYDWNGSDWALRGEPMTYDNQPYSETFGSAVSMPDENTLAVGEPENRFNPIVNHSEGFAHGLTRVYNWDGNEWAVRADIYSEFYGSRSGRVISMGDANHVAIGGFQASSLNGFQSGVLMVYQLDPVGINEQQTMRDFALYPNPTNGTITLEFDRLIEHAVISIFTIDGRLVDSQPVFGRSSFRYDLQEPAGLYFVQVTLPSGVQKTVRVIKQ